MEERLRKDKSLEVCLVCETTSSSTWSEEEKNKRSLDLPYSKYSVGLQCGTDPRICSFC